MSGTTQTFYDLTEFTDGGQVNLMSDAGSVNLAAGGDRHRRRTGGAGATRAVLSVAAPGGTFTAAGTMLGPGGAFSLDVGRIAGESLAALDTALNTGGFTLSRSIRVRTGNVVVDGTATAQTFDLSADHGAITVTRRGVIDASGAHGRHDRPGSQRQR